MTTDPRATAALDQWRASASSTLDVFVTKWRDARANPECSPEVELASLATYLRSADPGVVADLAAVAISRLGEQP